MLCPTPARLNRGGAQAFMQKRAAANKVHGASIMCGHDCLNTLLAPSANAVVRSSPLQLLFDQSRYAVLGQIDASRADTQGLGDLSHWPFLEHGTSQIPATVSNRTALSLSPRPRPTESFATRGPRGLRVLHRPDQASVRRSPCGSGHPPIHRAPGWIGEPTAPAVCAIGPACASGSGSIARS